MTEELIKTNFTILTMVGLALEEDVMWPPEPNIDQIRVAICDYLATKDIERVAVLHNGKATDMFVDGEGIRKGLPINKAATKIYRNFWLTKHPEDDPESLPPIYGTAVRFDRKVWF